MEGDTNNEPKPEHALAPLAVEIGIRLTERLVVNGVLSEDDAIRVYKNSLTSISELAHDAGALRILEAISRHTEPQ